MAGGNAMKFLLCWFLMVAVWACIAAAIGLQALIGFVMGVLAVIALSLAVGLAAASTYGTRDDEWEP
jgi:hypothetical protein